MEIENRLRGARSHRAGEVFENLISAACMHYKLSGEAYIEKTPEPVHILGKGQKPGTFLCNFASSAQPDYKGTLKGGQAICFEAKHTDSDRMLQDRVTEKQGEALSLHEALGAKCFVLAGFGMSDSYLVPWSIWKNMKTEFGRKYATEKDLAPYTIAWDVRGFMKFLDKVSSETKEEE